MRLIGRSPAASLEDGAPSFFRLIFRSPIVGPTFARAVRAAEEFSPVPQRGLTHLASAGYGSPHSAAETCDQLKKSVRG
jgi:hypothetical protein